MKLWWVLAWDHYYPSGGLRNVVSTHETKEEADEQVKIRLGEGCDNAETVNVSYLLGIGIFSERKENHEDNDE